MTPFLDVRTNPVGGPLARSVALYSGASISTCQTITTRARMMEAIHARNVLIGAHGFNVNRANGIDSLGTWAQLLLKLDILLLKLRTSFWP